MAGENSIERAHLASAVADRCRVVADSLNLAAMGEPQTLGRPPWVVLHTDTVHELCDHIDALVAIVKRGNHGA